MSSSIGAKLGGFKFFKMAAQNKFENNGVNMESTERVGQGKSEQKGGSLKSWRDFNFSKWPPTKIREKWRKQGSTEKVAQRKSGQKGGKTGYPLLPPLSFPSSPLYGG